MSPFETVSQDAQDPMKEGWIALAPVHLFPWILLLTGFLQDLIFALLPYEFHARIFVGWGFTLLRWVFGGLAVSVAFQARSQKHPGSLRQAALGLATAVLGLRICMALASQFAFRMGMHFYTVWMVLQGLFTLMGLGALILLLVGRDEDAGGRFDAAVAGLLFAGGLGWIGLPVLAIASMKGHPLLAAQWQALRDPKTALECGWFDGLDDALRLKNLGACALTFAVAFLALIGGLFTTFGHAGSLSIWWTSADIASAVLASLLLAIHVIRDSRRTGHRKGRGLAIAAILVAGLPLLLLLVGLVFLVLILTDVIHFRLF